MAVLLAQGKARKLNFSSAGSGSPGHLAAELLNEATRANMTHIPYKGNTPAVTAIISGEVDGGILATPGMLPHVKSGKITPLAEAKLKSLEQEVLYVAVVPAATPEPVVQRLQKISDRYGRLARATDIKVE